MDMPILLAVFWLCTMYFAFKIERIKKNNDIQTYKEIVAFTEGRRLDEIKSIEEKAKRPYQKLIALFGSALLALLICVLLSLFI